MGPRRRNSAVIHEAEELFVETYYTERSVYNTVLESGAFVVGYAQNSNHD